jgi:hypothetical protein
VVVETETQSKNFIYHGHDPNKVDILITLNNDITGEVRGMKPTEWRKLLPKKIIVVDPEDFIKSTHEMRKNYALKKEEERKKEYAKLRYIIRIEGIKRAFVDLYRALIEEEPYKDPLQEEAFYKAAEVVTFKFLNFYNISLEEPMPKNESVPITKIESLAYELFKSGRKFSDLTDEEKEFITKWLEIFRTEYISRL